MSSRAFPLSNFQPPQSLRLGCLIVNTEDIHQDIHDPFQDRPTAAEISVNEHGSFHETRTLSKSSKFRTFLSDVLSISRERQSEGASSVTAPQLTTHKLRNYSTWFQDACGTPETRTWLERAVNNRNDVYLLVGFFILSDAKLTKVDTSATAGATGTGVPLLPAGLAFLNTMISLTTGVRCTRDVSYGRISLLDAPGEQIFGVWYRKVKFKWSFSRQAGAPSLGEKTCWKPFWEWRAGADDSEDSEEEEEDILEASIEGESDWEEDDNKEDDSKGEDCHEGASDMVSTEISNVAGNRGDCREEAMETVSTGGSNVGNKGDYREETMETVPTGVSGAVNITGDGADCQERTSVVAAVEELDKVNVASNGEGCLHEVEENIGQEKIELGHVAAPISANDAKVVQAVQVKHYWGERKIFYCSLIVVFFLVLFPFLKSFISGNLSM